MTIFLGIVIIILLLVSLIPNMRAAKKSKLAGQKNTRFNIMIGVDALLLVLVIATLIFQFLK
ncbi:hypothetical protein [Staphylococcus kloosii]|jgi:heme/copper-type cytochrome/quinol oxidase subunit 2|uniref:hypothetical protein n=1 Tax=Staphylococcus kloosii TaxID=29384 RepID=UPI00189D465F|nr:hypothetical protein [Staphylococcus kloosii]MBF7024752.1 hypothetical protein [Staphylococcus kloosii]